MAVFKVIHYKDILKCNHGGKVDLDPTVERDTEIKDDLRVVTDKDLLEKVTISGCSLSCSKITSIPKGLSRNVEVKDAAIPVLSNLKAVTDKGCIVTFQGPMDIAAAVDHLDSNAQPHSISKCGKYVENAIRAGGLDIPGADAKDLGPVLTDHGFESVATNSDSSFTPQKGDVVVWDAVNGHPYGHTAMWDGSQWVSDFKQKNFVVSDAYKNGTYTIYRDKAANSAGNQAHAGPK